MTEFGAEYTRLAMFLKRVKKKVLEWPKNSNLFVFNELLLLSMKRCAPV